MANTLTFANQTLTDANIFGGINYICDLNTGDEFSIGNTASACVSFVTDTQVPLYTKDQTNGFFSWTQDLTARGTYYVTEVTKVNSSRYNVTAYDAMILLDTSVSALSLSYPVTVSAAASAIATYLGCSTSGTIYNGTQAAAGGTIADTTTIRQLLGWVAEASGASVKIDASGDIAFLYYASSGITVTASDYIEDGLDVADYTCAAIDNVTICDMAGMTAATAGLGTNSLFIQGNPFLYEATNTEAAVILGLVDSFVYAPFTCEMFDENGLDVGVTATFGSTTTLVMHLESSDGGAVASAVGSDSRAELNKSLEIIVNEALAVANDAQQTVQDLNLHFWYTASGSEAGAHIAEVDKPTFEANPSGGNLLSNTNGIKVRKGTDDLATFGADGIHVENGSGTEIAHLGYGPGEDSGGGISDAPYYTLGYRTGAVGNYSVAEGEGSEASGYVSHAEGGICKATGTYSHAEGFNNTASGTASHAEGTLCTASNTYAHAEGAGSTASGSDSHAEGTDTTASGDGSHAEGAFTIASGDYSHAQNAYTKASSDYQTALGAFNIEDNADTYAVIVGNGTSDNARSNALTVDWSGNVVTAGDITDGTGNVLSNKAESAALANYVLKATPYYDLDTTASPGTTDGDLYAAITALSWQSDVIV